MGIQGICSHVLCNLMHLSWAELSPGETTSLPIHIQVSLPSFSDFFFFFFPLLLKPNTLCESLLVWHVQLSCALCATCLAYVSQALLCQRRLLVCCALQVCAAFFVEVCRNTFLKVYFSPLLFSAVSLACNQTSWRYRTATGLPSDWFSLKGRAGLHA